MFSTEHKNVGEIREQNKCLAGAATHVSILDAFGCHPKARSLPVHDSAQELMAIPGVKDHMTCVHLCKYGVEASCNLIDYRHDTESCVLACLPTDQGLYIKTNPGFHDRTICLQAGIRYSQVPFWSSLRLASFCRRKVEQLLADWRHWPDQSIWQ